MSGYSRWHDAMIAQTKLLDFSTSEIGRRFLIGFGNSMNKMHVESARVPDGLIHYLQVQMLKDAEPIYVASHILDLVEHARETFEPEVLLPSDPFVPNGFALLPYPIRLEEGPLTKNVTGIEQAPFRAIAWQSIHTEDLERGCTWISLYTHIDDDPDEAWQGWDSDPTNDVERMRRFWHTHSPLGLAHTFQWTWGTMPWRDAEAATITTPDYEETEEDVRRRGKDQSRLIQTFWRICQQAVPAKHRAPRGIWKDANRKQIKHKDITIITLRRLNDPADYEPTGRVLTVAHLVRGYWGRRHTKDGVRQVWIKPYIRGGNDLDFQETERVWEVRR